MKKIQKHPMEAYCIFSALCLGILFIIFFCTNGYLIDKYFMWDWADTGMDYFNSIAYTSGGVPYSEYDTLYPPLANLFFYVLNHFVPKSVVDSWEKTFENLFVMKMTSRDIRLQQSAMVFFLFFIVITAVLAAYLIEYLLRGRRQGAARATAISMIFSFGFTWGIERGNIILLAFVLCLFFLAFYRHENRMLREASYLALAVAAGLKLYPAFLGILLLVEKDWKAAGRTILYGACALILPCFFLKDGIQGLFMFVEILLSKGNTMDLGQLGLHHTGTGLKDFAGNIIAIYAKLRGTDESLYTAVLNGFQTVAYVLCAVGLVSALRKGWKNWERVLIICLVMTSIQSGAYYTAVYLLIPLILFFREEDALTRKNVGFVLPMVMIALQIPLFDLKGLKLKALWVQGWIVLLWLATLAQIVLRRKGERRVTACPD